MAPCRAAINQFLRQLKVNLQFLSYWDFVSKEVAEAHMETQRVPGHAQEFETAFALAVFPDSVRTADIDDEDAKLGTPEMGKVLVEATVAGTTEFVSGMLEGTVQAELTGL